jgi:hypothetical protein
MTTRQDITTEARSWLGTPYQHQARCKHVGVDCAGLIVGVAKALGISEFDFTRYGRSPLGNALLEIMHCNTRALPWDAPYQAGQIALMRFDAEPQHLGIICTSLNPPPLGEGRVGEVALAPTHQNEPTPPTLTLIHAYGHAGKVVEHRLAQVWRSRIVARFDYLTVVN